jgi:hypothetical protein
MKNALAGLLVIDMAEERTSELEDTQQKASKLKNKEKKKKTEKNRTGAWRYSSVVEWYLACTEPWVQPQHRKKRNKSEQNIPEL